MSATPYDAKGLMIGYDINDTVHTDSIFGFPSQKVIG
jgi:hypothetical protein